MTHSLDRIPTFWLYSTLRLLNVLAYPSLLLRLVSRYVAVTPFLKLAALCGALSEDDNTIDNANDTVM